jgi:hypothetical protein
MVQLEACPIQCRFQSLRREMIEVARDVQMKPFPPREIRLPACEVWNICDQAPSRSKALRALAQQCHGIGDVLENLEHDDQIKLRLRGKRLDRLRQNLDLVRFAANFRRRFVAFQAEYSPPAALESGKHKPGTTSNFQDGSPTWLETAPPSHTKVIERFKNHSHERAISPVPGRIVTVEVVRQRSGIDHATFRTPNNLKTVAGNWVPRFFINCSSIVIAAKGAGAYPRSLCARGHNFIPRRMNGRHFSARPRRGA